MYEKIIDYFTQPGGLAMLHVIQFIIFGLMAGILIVEFRRRGIKEMLFKLIASATISLLNLGLAIAQYNAHFTHSTADQRVLPLVSSLVVGIVIILLSRAFIYDHVMNQRAFLIFLLANLAIVFLFFFSFQLTWLNEYVAGAKYAKSWMQCVTSIHIVLIIMVLMWFISRYRREFRYRLYVAFGAVMAAQLVTIAEYFVPSVGALSIVRAIVPVLRPIMFGSIIFHELIHSNERLNESLVAVFKEQQAQLHELQTVNKTLGSIAEKLFNKSMESWETLTAFRDDLQKRIFAKIRSGPQNLKEDFEKKISFHSRELEELASMSEELQGQALKVSQSIHSIQKMQEKISSARAELKNEKLHELN